MSEKPLQWLGQKILLEKNAQGYTNLRQTLERFAHVEEEDGSLYATFTINRHNLKRAGISGTDAAQVLSFLRENSDEPVPQALEVVINETLEDIVSRVGIVSLVRVGEQLALCSRDETLIDRVESTLSNCYLGEREGNYLYISPYIIASKKSALSGGKVLQLRLENENITIQDEEGYLTAEFVSWRVLSEKVNIPFHFLKRSIFTAQGVEVFSTTTRDEWERNYVLWNKSFEEAVGCFKRKVVSCISVAGDHLTRKADDYLKQTYSHEKILGGRGGIHTYYLNMLFSLVDFETLKLNDLAAEAREAGKDLLVYIFEKLADNPDIPQVLGRFPDASFIANSFGQRYTTFDEYCKQNVISEGVFDAGCLEAVAIGPEESKVYYVRESDELVERIGRFNATIKKILDAYRDDIPVFYRMLLEERCRGNVPKTTQVWKEIDAYDLALSYVLAVDGERNNIGENIKFERKKLLVVDSETSYGRVLKAAAKYKGFDLVEEKRLSCLDMANPDVVKMVSVIDGL